MYLVYLDDTIIYDPRVEDRRLINPKLTLEVGKNGSFNFQMPTNNVGYDKLKDRISIITIYQVYVKNGFIYRDELFRGTPISSNKNFYNIKNVECEGELTFFNDTIVRPYNFSGSVSTLFKQYVNNHNSTVESYKRFVPRRCTVTDPNDYIVRANENYPTTKEEMDEKLPGLLGGHFETGDNGDGTRYIDYLEEYSNVASQNIEFGKNLIDITEYIKTEDVITRLIPLGVKDEETGERLTIKSVNGGKDYLQDNSAVSIFGIIEAIATYDDVTIASNLLNKGKKALENCINATVSIELSAADLHNLDKDISAFRIGDNVRVISKPHGLDRYFLLSKMYIELDNPANCNMILGAVFKTFTQKQIEKEKMINAVANNISIIQEGASSAISKASSAESTANNASSTAKEAKTTAETASSDVADITKKIAEYEKKIDDAVTNAFKKAYPVGRLYFGTTNTNPNAILGFGTWSLWGQGRVPVGVNENDSDFNSAEKTGGEKKHTLTLNEIPSHSHVLKYVMRTVNDSNPYLGTIIDESRQDNEGTLKTASAGGGQAHNNLQPYITCYIWKRTA